MSSDPIIKKLEEKINNRILNMNQNFNLKTSGEKRTSKGNYVVDIYSYIIDEAIKNTNSDLKFYTSETSLPEKEKIRIPKIDMSEEYIINNNLKFEDKNDGYKCSYDGFLLSKDKIEIFFEFKAYVENTMWKRCLFDASMIKQLYPEDSIYCMCMLESQMGNTKNGEVIREIGIKNHSLTFYMENLNLLPQMQIFILMDGQRKINKDIADLKFTKEVNIQKVAKTYNFFLNFLS
tara:strand:- start:167 stop:868 length:702 start_codon:yes stop_codon:yes gene_type:complete